MTIYDLAELAGVSASTVSRVLNNKEGIKAETRKKILKLAELHGFEINETARGLSTSVTNMVGILIADIRNNHYTEIAYVVEKYLRDNNYCSIIINVGSDIEDMKIGMKTLRQRKVDGLVIIGSVFQNDIVKEEIKNNMKDLPVVFANGDFDLDNVYGVMVDEYNGLVKCVELLYDRGYNNIAYVGGTKTASNINKKKGFVDGVIKNGKNPIVVEMYTKTLNEVKFQPIDELLKTNPEVDGMIFANDFLAAETMQYLVKKGVDVPTDIGFIGINNDKCCELTYSKLTSLDNKMGGMGLVSGTILVDLLNGKNKVDKIMLISEIVMRESVKEK